MRNIFPFIIILLFLGSCTQNPNNQTKLDHWELGRLGESETYPASVPGCVHTDLFANGLIGDPFFGENESKQQWIGEKEWVYTMTFVPDEQDYIKENIELIFEGLDTYAKVYLNDSLILEADNMFSTWRLDVKDILMEKENLLKVIFSPPGKINEEKAKELSYQLPDTRAFTRKAPYHFGWDWGPEFVTCGIWKPVYLKAWDEFMVGNMHVKHGDITENPIPLNIHIDIESSKEQEVKIILFNELDQEIAAETISLDNGLNHIPLNASIEDPELWWPVGLGPQHLYNIRAQIIGESKSEMKTSTFGIREIELVREADPQGESFYFKVNDLALFMKGANYIPQDNFLPRVDDSKYEKLISSVLDANMNMLRVWGGGVYESDIFYELCDKYGILVWQDFMFACNMYPGDDAFLENVKQEAIDNVSRLSNHPCIALWCGNNEIDEGWHNWGWQQSLEYSEEDSAKIWHDYLKVFHDILPGVVEENDPGTIYWPSSPMTGWGRDAAYTQGDVHYWGVWWGEEPFEMYRKKIGRFVTEYGFQGMPPIQTIEAFGGLSFPSPQSPVPSPQILDSHQKHPRGTELIQKYMEREFHIPERFEDYVYVSQVLQAEGMAEAFLSHRVSQPYCMGTLYWQLNDCWPVTSWSGLDYYGRWKALHYHVKRAYQPVMVGSIESGGRSEVYIVNDHPYDIELDFAMSSYSMKKVIRQDLYKEKVFIPALSSTKVKSFPPRPNENRSSMMLLCAVSMNDSIISRSFNYFVPTKELKLEEPDIKWEVNGNKIILQSEKLARQVFLKATGVEGRFSDNFFDMAPGEIREVWFIGDNKGKMLSEQLKIISIYDTYQ